MLVPAGSTGSRRSYASFARLESPVRRRVRWCAIGSRIALISPTQPRTRSYEPLPWRLGSQQIAMTAARASLAIASPCLVRFSRRVGTQSPGGCLESRDRRRATHAENKRRATVHTPSWPAASLCAERRERIAVVHSSHCPRTRTWHARPEPKCHFSFHAKVPFSATLASDCRKLCAQLDQATSVGDFHRSPDASSLTIPVMTRMSDSLRAAIIGTGNATGWSVGHVHAQSYVRRGHRLVAGIARTSESLARFRACFRVDQTGTDVASILAATSPDIVSICTFPPTHLDFVKAAVAAGARGIWLEKPMAMSIADARAIVAVCEGANVSLVVNHQRRFLDLYRRAAALVADGAIGAPTLIAGAGGGWDLVDWGTHAFDIVRHLLGDTSAIEVSGQRVLDGAARWSRPLERSGHAYVRFEGGARAVIDSDRDGQSAEGFVVIGAGGVLCFRNRRSLQVHDAKGTHRIPVDSDMHHPIDRSFDAALDSLVRRMHGGPKSEIDGGSGLATTELMLASLRAATEGRPVTLPLGAY